MNDNDNMKLKVMAGQVVNVDMLMDIAAFHTKFEIPRPATPSLLPAEDMGFRLSFLFEEMQELVDAYEGDNLEEQFDALIDLVYVALGTAWMLGVPFGEGWARVHNANMKKVRCTDEFDPRSKRMHKLDVVKPEGWEPPYLKDLVSPIVMADENDPQ